jgi:hypothetical protein
MISGKPHLNWTAYKEIEWLAFPRFFSLKAAEQDLGAIQQLEAVGQFRLEASPTNCGFTRTTSRNGQTNL